MRQNTQALAATMVGAVVGGLAGYMFFTESGRAWRRQLEPQLEDLMREVNQFRGTLAKASSFAGEGWRMMNEAMQEHASASDPRASAPYGRSSQSHPF